MNFYYLNEEAKRIIEECPDLESEVLDFVQLAHSEVEEGGSESHECELAINDILELEKEYKLNK